MQNLMASLNDRKPDSLSANMTMAPLQMAVDMQAQMPQRSL